MAIKNKKVAVAMSGGVDSSVAAALLKKQGYDVMGIFMKFWHESDSNLENKCCSLDAFSDASRVARQLGIPIYTFNFRQDFKKAVVDDFLKNYQNGLTPNPCVRCNQFIKFGLFYKKAMALGCDYMATGHYVQVKKSGKEYSLLAGKDKAKDQSYFLWTLGQDQLKHLLLPIGKYRKSEVRKLAKSFKLPVSQKPDSQEICFTPKRHNDFLKKHLKLKKGDIITTLGKKIGEHQGLPLYTIGQRKGIEIGGIGPFYVVKMDYGNNKLIVSSNCHDANIYGNKMAVREVSWQGKAPKLPLVCQVKIRYGHPAVPAKVMAGKNKKQAVVSFKADQRAITPGQSAVFYRGQKVLGGGIIA